MAHSSLPRAKKIKINGLRFQVYQWGKPKNPKLFLFHGWLDTGAGFHFLCEHLSHRFHCIAPDMRGYGKSQHSRSSLGYFFFEYLADLHALLKFFAPKSKVSLLGHSLGGIVTSTYAGTYPERIRHLINVEGFAFQRSLWKDPVVRARTWLEGMRERNFVVYPDRRLFELRLKKTYPKLQEARIAFLARYLGKHVAGGYQMAADPKHKQIEPYPFAPELLFQFWKNIRAKSLFVFAQDTEMVRYFPKGAFAKEMQWQRRRFPKGCRTVTIPHCGHMVHYEKPEALAAQILKFVK